MIKLETKERIERVNNEKVFKINDMYQKHGLCTVVHNGQAYAWGVEWEKK